MRMNRTSRNQFWYDIIRIKLMIPHMRWGTCSGDDNECGGNIITKRRDADFGPVVVKNMPVGVCEICGEEYHNLFLMVEIEGQTLTAIWRILDWKHLRKKNRG